MKLFAHLAGQEHELEVDFEEGRARIQIGNRCYEVDAASSGAIESLIIDGCQFEAVANHKGSGSYHVVVGEFDGEVSVFDPLERLAAGQNGASGGRGAQRVDAYMPGRVVSLLVAEGDEVEEGQGVLVLEAMKMENEIQSEMAGVIKKIHVEEGQAVESGDPLFELE
jgi:biotin carboxyl carrier protein